MSIWQIPADFDLGIEPSSLPLVEDETENAFNATLQPITHEEALNLIFRNANPGDYVATTEKRPLPDAEPDDDGCEWVRTGPVIHPRHDSIYSVLNATEHPLYINLGSYRDTSLRSARPKMRKLFDARKVTARGLHGVFVDLDVGRSPDDPKAHVPGALLTQHDLLWRFEALVYLGKIPPPHLWVFGTRGCYAIWLFDKPETDIELAKAKWKILREHYLIPRLYELAIDPHARAIIQNLKAPGACGRVGYNKVVDVVDGDLYNFTSLDLMLSFCREWPEQCDIPEPEPRKPRKQRELSPEKTYTRRKKQPADATWCRERADDMIKVTRHLGGRPGYPRRRYFRDLASAIKTWHFYNSPKNIWFKRACHEIEKHNRELADPLHEDKLKKIIHEAKVGLWRNVESPHSESVPHRNGRSIVRDMGITEELCDQLGLIQLRKPFDEDNHRRRMRNKRAASEARKAEREFEKQEEREARRAQRRAAHVEVAGPLRQMIRDRKATSEIERVLGVHRQKITRERKLMKSEGEVVPEPVRMKTGRKTGGLR